MLEECGGQPSGAACRRMDPQLKEADLGVEKSCVLKHLDLSVLFMLEFSDT